MCVCVFNHSLLRTKLTSIFIYCAVLGQNKWINNINHFVDYHHTFQGTKETSIKSKINISFLDVWSSRNPLFTGQFLFKLDTESYVKKRFQFSNGWVKTSHPIQRLSRIFIRSKHWTNLVTEKKVKNENIFISWSFFCFSINDVNDHEFVTNERNKNFNFLCLVWSRRLEVSKFERWNEYGLFSKMFDFLYVLFPSSK